MLLEHDNIRTQRQSGTLNSTHSLTPISAGVPQLLTVISHTRVWLPQIRKYGVIITEAVMIKTHTGAETGETGMCPLNNFRARDMIASKTPTIMLIKNE